MLIESQARRLTLLIAAGAAIAFVQARAETIEKRIPDEYESLGGDGLALNNGGYALADAHAAVRGNPALLAGERQYSVSGAYHWPSAGREYYQAGIVDSKTAAVAAGVTYTGYTDDYRYPYDGERDTVLDSPVLRRGVLGVAQAFGAYAIGAGATYVEANPLLSSEERLRGETVVRGVGVNLGLTAAPGRAWRLGLAGENLSNRRINDYVPRTYKAGVAYVYSSTLTASLDYRQRERVLEFEGATTGLDFADSDQGLGEDPEQFAMASLSALLGDTIRLAGSYGHALSSDKRRSLAAAAALVNRSFSLAYIINRPYLSRGETHQAVNLTFAMAM